jgi:hypothetical protein
LKERDNRKYVIKVFEAQWDEKHNTSVKSFFEQLKRQTSDIEENHNKSKRYKMYHDALYKYKIFQTAEGLRSNITEKDIGVGGRKKIGYFACHGRKGAICAVNNISRTQLKNIFDKLTSYDGLFFGTCDFVDADTARYFLDSSPHLKWIAGYEMWTPWLEGTINDLLFFRLLLSGSFSREKKYAKWGNILKPEDAAKELYITYIPASSLKFSLYYRGKNDIRSTLKEYNNEFDAFVSRLPNDI